MNEEALIDAYNLFKRNGYGDSIEDFKVLISKNSQALRDSYSLFVSEGYGDSIDDYKKLLGVGVAPVVKKKSVLDSSSEAGSLVSQESTRFSPFPPQQPVAPQVDGEPPVKPMQKLTKEDVDFSKISKEKELPAWGQDIIKEQKKLEKTLKDIVKSKEIEKKKYEDIYDKQLSIKPRIEDSQYLKDRLSSINTELINKEEEYVVPELQYQFGDLGFKFEESGATGDYVKVTAPNGKTTEISLDNFLTSKSKTESEILKKFIKENTPSKGLFVLEKTMKEEDVKFNSEKQVENSIKSISNELSLLNNKQKDFLLKRTELEKQYEELSRTPQNQRTSQEFIDKVSELDKQKILLDSEMKSILQEEERLNQKGKKLDSAVGKYTIAKSKQGDWIGGIRNAILGGIGKISSGFTSLTVDITSELMPLSGLMPPKMLAEKSFEGAEKLGITVPIDKSEKSFNEFKKTLTESQLNEIESYVRDQAKKSAKEDLLPAMRIGAEELFGDIETTKQWKNLKKEGFWGGAILGLAESLPAMIGGAGPAGWAQRTALMYAQVSDGLSEEMENDPDFKDITENEKLAITLPIGITSAVLENYGLRNIMASKGVINSIAMSVLGKTGRGVTAKSFRELVENEVESKLAKGALIITAAGAAEFETGAAQELTETSFKMVYDKIKEKDMFNTPDSIKDLMENVVVSGAQEAVGGFVLGVPSGVSAAYSKKGFLKMDDVTFETFANMANDEKMQSAYIASLKEKITSGILTQKEAKEQLNNYRSSVGLFRQLPDGLNTQQKKEAMNLLKEKRDLETYIDGKDPALVVKQKNRITEINDSLTKISEQPTAEYIINNTKYTKEEFFNQLQDKTQDELKAMNIVVNNDEQTATEIGKLFNIKTEQDAIQKQAAGQVPVQPTTRVGETMEEGKPQAEPEVTTEEGVKEEVTQTIINPTQLEALPTDVKMTTEFTQEDGTLSPVMGNEKMLSDMYTQAMATPETERTQPQVQSISVVETLIPTAPTTEVAPTAPTAEVIKVKKSPDFINDAEHIVTVNDEEVGRMYYDRSSKSWRDPSFDTRKYKPYSFERIYGDILGDTKQEATDELIRRRKESTKQEVPVEEKKEVVFEEPQGVQFSKDTILNKFLNKLNSLNPIQKNPIDNKSFLYGDKASLEFNRFDKGNKNEISLEGITSLDKGKGFGKEAMSDITKSADELGTTLTLDAKPFGKEGLGKKELINFYKNNGFEVDQQYLEDLDFASEQEAIDYVLENESEALPMVRKPQQLVALKEVKPTAEVNEIEKIKSDIEVSKERLKKAWDKYKTMGIAFDPKNQLAKDKELVKSLINYAFHNIKLGSYNAAKLIEDLASEGFEITRNGAKFIMDKASKKVQREIDKTVGIKPKPTEQKRINKAFSIGVATQKIATEEAKAEVKDLKAQISDLFKAGIEALKIARNTAKNKERAQKEIIQNLTKEINNLSSTGKITAKQAANIVSAFSKVDVFNQDSIDKFTDYMARVFEKAEYAENISEIKSKLKNAKKNVQTKIGVSQSLTPLMSRLFSIDPTLIPDSVFDKYTELVDMMSERKAVLNLEEYGKVLDKTEEVLDIVNQELSKKEELSEIFNSYEEKVINEEGKIDFNETLKKMLKEELINEDDIDIMKRYKNFILQTSLKEKKSDEEIEQEKQDLLEALNDIDVDSDGLSMKDERNLARELSKLIRTDAVKKLNNTELNNLLRVINNINNGYLPHYTQLIVERLKAKNNSEVLNNAIKKAKPLAVSSVYSKFKSLLTGKDKLTELIRRNPLFYIDQVFGDFKTKDIFNSIFEKAAEAQSMFKKAVNDLTNKLDAAEESVAKSFKYDANKTLMSKFKMMTFMIQLEYESNPNNKRVNPASKYLEKTIEHIKDSKSSFGDRDADMLQEILNKYIDKDGNIDNNKLYDSFNSAEKKAIRTIQNINNEMRDKAIYTASIIRGDKIHPLNNYIHLNVLHEHKPDEALLGAAFIDTYNNSLRPSTKAKSLIERTGKVSPLNFDVFASANRGAKFTLMDYYLTEPIRTARKTLNETSNLLKEEKVSREKKDIFNAIERSFEESVDNLLTNNFMSTSFGDKVASYISQQGYRAMLASIPRFISEFSSNFAFAVITAPKDFAVGIKYRDVVLSSDAANIMDNVKSKQTNRIFSKDTLSGRFIDTSILNQVSGVKGGRAKNDVANKVQQIYNKSVKKYKNFVDITADSLISTPDKMIMRPVWFGSFANEFKKITGNDIDFDKIASNDEIYMSKNKEAIDAARDFADQKTVFTGAADNAFMGVLKGTSKPNQSALLKGFNMFNSFMTNFLIYEYITARTGVMASIGNGSISKKEGIALLAGVTVRMTMYTVLMNILTEEFARLFSDEEDEDDEKTLLQKIGQGITSSFTSLVLGRDFGNSTKALINYGVERVNEKYLDFLRSGEYDPYKDAIQYTVISPDKKGKQSSFSDMIMNMMGPFGPSMKTAELIFKKITEPEKKKLDAIKRTQKEKAIRIPLEVLGNIGMIPLYKDVRKIVNNEIYKDLRNVKVDTEAQQEKEQVKKEKINALEEVINKSNDRAVRSAAKEMIEDMKEDDPEKLEEIKEERKQKKEEKESLLIDERTGIEYDNESDLKKYNKNLWEKNFGEGSEWYRKNKAEKEAEKMMRKIITKEEEEEYDYTPKKKKNKDGSRKRGYENRFTRGYENRFTRD